MFPSYRSKSDMNKKWNDLKSQVELDNQIEAAKQQMFKDMIWSVDMDKKSIKEFTSTQPMTIPKIRPEILNGKEVQQLPTLKIQNIDAPKESFSKEDLRNIVKEELDNAIGKPDPYKQKLEDLVKSNPDFFRGSTYRPLNKQGNPLEKKYIDEFANIKTDGGNQSTIDIDYEKTVRDVERRLSVASSSGTMSPSEISTSHISGKEKIASYFRQNPGELMKHQPVKKNGHVLDNYVVGMPEDGKIVIYNKNTNSPVNGKRFNEQISWNKTFEHIAGKRVDPTEGAIHRMGKLDIRGQSDSSSSSSSATSNASMGKGFSKIISRRHVMGGMAIGKADVLNKDYLWRPIGCKFINLKSLGQGFLSLRHPSNQPVGKRIKLNDDIMDMLREYIYDGKFDMDKYDSLPQSSKEFMYDLLKITRLTNAFRKPLKDPYLNKDYNAELDKLVGEIRVGNDNKANKDELKRILLHMIETKSISDSKLRSLMPLI